MDKSAKAKEKLIRERTKLLLFRPFFGILALGLEFVPDEKIPSMSVDGTSIFYNPNFVLLRPSTQIRTLIAHEVLHCALGHLWRQGAREQDRWNYATDHAVNLILKKEGFNVPEDCHCNPEFDGMEAERIYTKLKSEKKRLLDSHEKWPGKKSEEKDKRDTKDNSDDGTERSGVKKDQKPPKNVPEKNVDARGNQSKDKLEKKWKEQIAKADAIARMIGKLPGATSELIKSALSPKMNWRDILFDLVLSLAKNDFRLTPPNKKHLWREMYLPSLKGATLEIALAGDESGSISKEQYEMLLAEVKGITEQFDSYTIHFYLCDMQINFQTTLTEFNEWPDKFEKHSGATSFVPVFEAIEEEGFSPTVLIYLTDGDGEYPKYDPGYPVIWILNQEHEVPFGTSIVIGGEE